MTRPQGWLALILALAIGSLLVLRSLPLSLGLDLRGGSQLTLLVEPAGRITKVESKQLEAVKEVLERRVNGLGVSEATVTTSSGIGTHIQTLVHFVRSITSIVFYMI